MQHCSAVALGARVHIVHESQRHGNHRRNGLAEVGVAHALDSKRRRCRKQSSRSGVGRVAGRQERVHAVQKRWKVVPEHSMGLGLGLGSGRPLVHCLPDLDFERRSARNGRRTTRGERHGRGKKQPAHEILLAVGESIGPDGPRRPHQARQQREHRVRRVVQRRQHHLLRAVQLDVAEAIKHPGGERRAERAADPAEIGA